MFDDASEVIIANSIFVNAQFNCKRLCILNWISEFLFSGPDASWPPKIERFCDPT